MAKRTPRDRQLAVVEVPLFRVGMARVHIADALRTVRGTERDLLCRADAALREAQTAIAAWSGYQYQRR